MQKIKNYVNNKIHRFIINYFEKKLLPMAFALSYVKYTCIDKEIKWHIQFDEGQNTFFQLAMEYKRNSSKLNVFLFNCIFVIHAFLENSSLRQNEVVHFVRQNVIGVNAECFNKCQYKYNLSDDLEVKDVVSKVMAATFLNIEKFGVPVSKIKTPSNVYDFIAFIRRYRVNQESDYEEEWVYDPDGISNSIIELCTDNLACVVNLLFNNTTKSFIKFFRDRLFDINGNLDFAFLTYALLIPRRKEVGIEQLKRILNSAPGAINYYLFDSDYDANESDLIDGDLVTNNLSNFCIEESDFFDLENDVFALFFSYAMVDESFDIKELNKLESILNKMFEKYDNNQIERLFSTRHGFVYFAIIVLTELENHHSKFDLENCKVLEIDETFKDMICYIAEKKEINNEELTDLNGKTIDGFHYKLLQTAMDYREAASSFNNCVLSYFTEYPEQDVMAVYSIENDCGVACISIDEDGEVDQFLGPHNDVLVEEKRDKIQKVLNKYLN